MSKNARLRFYNVYDDTGEYRLSVIATTAKEAKKMSFGDDRIDGCDWIEVSVKWKRDVDITGFKEGVFEDCLEAHKRGIFNSFGTSDGCEYCKVYQECQSLSKNQKSYSKEN